MEESKTTSVASHDQGKNQERGVRRKRWEMGAEDVRFFLPKPGSTVERPELGQETSTEGDALVQAFRTGQPFYTLVAWKAVHEFEGGETKIVKRVVGRSSATRT